MFGRLLPPIISVLVSLIPEWDKSADASFLKAARCGVTTRRVLRYDQARSGCRVADDTFSIDPKATQVALRSSPRDLIY